MEAFSYENFKRPEEEFFIGKMLGSKKKFALTIILSTAEKNYI
jgi:hypothetical protein